MANSAPATPQATADDEQRARYAPGHDDEQVRYPCHRCQAGYFPVSTVRGRHE